MSPQGGVDAFFMVEKNLLATGAQWVWLYEIEVPTDPPTRYRFVRTPEAVTFRGNVYSPFPIVHSVMRETDAGDLPSITMTVSNVSQEIIGTLESYSGLIDQRVRIILTNMEALSTGNAILEHDFKILTMTVTAEAAAAQLGDISLYETFFPGQRLMRHYCRHQYRSAACGYSVDSADADYLSGCDKSLDGANGCEVHGASETAAGVTVIHPDRFGGFPGIPTPTTGGSI
jgi:lambda family phage minor tail protein L